MNLASMTQVNTNDPLPLRLGAVVRSAPAAAVPAPPKPRLRAEGLVNYFVYTEPDGKLRVESVGSGNRMTQADRVGAGVVGSSLWRSFVEQADASIPFQGDVLRAADYAEELKRNWIARKWVPKEGCHFVSPPHSANTLRCEAK
jgi:hypothetical protein